MSSLITKFLDLNELEEKYSRILDKSHFAGDVVLSESELIEICNNMRNYLGYILSNELNNLLLIVAVNIAYFYYDDKGFWKHFYEVCKFEWNTIPAEKVGEKIEKALLDKKLLKYKRSGPFRYVGAILEQTGITNCNILPYARLMQEIIEVYRIKNLRDITYQKYKYMVEYSECSKYLKEYLLDESGWDFTLYILKMLYYIENKTISINDLDEFKGMHPGFWREFFKYYSLNNTICIRDKCSTFLKPILLYDKINAVIYIRLPSTEYVLDEFEVISNKRSNINIYLNSNDKLVSKYTGDFIGKSGEKLKWEICGWDPDSERYAYFHEKYGYIKNIENIREGNYYVITNSESNIPIGKTIKCLGKLNISALTHFSAFQVKIEENSNRITHSAKVVLNWANKDNLLALNSYYDIFINDLPQISISNVNMLENDKEILLYDIGYGIKRIRDYKNLSELRKEISVKKIVKGQIWTEDMQRTRVSSNLMFEESLKFCVIPLCELHLPEAFYSVKDKIMFKSNSHYINYQNCEKKENGLWLVNEGIETLEGRILVDKGEAYFNYAIYRGYIIVNNDHNQHYFNIDNIQNNDIIRVYGKPKTNIDIAIYDGEQMHTIMPNIKLDEKGEYEFEYYVLKNDLEKLNLEAGMFYLGLSGKHINANMGYFNFRNLLERSCESDSRIHFLEKINENVARKINQILILYSSKQNHLIYLEPDKNTKELDAIYKMMVIMSQLFDEMIVEDKHGLIIEFSLTEVKINEVLNTITWYKNAINAVDNGLVANICVLKEEYNNLKWYPEIQRWNDKVNKVYLELNNLSDIQKTYIEWAEEVKKQKKLQLKSNIACRKGGDQLTFAWIEYLKGNYISAIDKLANIYIKEENIITDLKVLLKATIYIKLARISALKNLINCSNINSPEVKVVLNTYDNICRVILGEELQNQDNVEKSVTIFPFRQDDIEFIMKSNMIFKKKICENIEEFKKSRNWIVNLVAFKYMKSDKVIRDIFFKNFKSLIQLIPESPEKEEVIKKIIN